MRYILLALTLLMVASTAQADRMPIKFTPSSTIGSWSVAGIDIGSGANQIRLIPDGAFVVHIKKNHEVTISGSSRNPTITGAIKWKPDSTFNFKSNEKKASSFNGVVSVTKGRMIVSFKWQGAPVSVLLHKTR